MYPMQNPYYQSYQRFNPYQQAQPQFITQPVGSFDEAKGFPVDPNIGYLFPDTGNGRIYFKQLNMNTGKSEIVTYAPIQEEKHEDFNSMVTRRLDSIEKTLGGLDESISGISKHWSGDKKSNGNDSAKDAE